MGRYILRRLFFLVPVLIGISVLVFALVHLAPGDPVVAMLGIHPTAQEATRLRHELGLDKPLPEQYFVWLWRMLHGRLGTSLYAHEPVSTLILQRLPTTAELAGASIAIAVIAGIPLGVLSATKRGGVIDHTARFVSVVGISMPVFWLGILLIIAFSLEVHWFPPGGSVAEQGAIALVLPSLTLGLSFVGVVMRMTRASMLESLSGDYVKTARAKGLFEWEVHYKHALPNALLPVTTVIGLQVGTLLSGAVLTEAVFSLPGLGSLMADAVGARDYPLIMGSVLVVAALFVVVNLVVDVLYALIDPRVRLR